MLGGMSRVREVLTSLWPHCTPEGLTQALDAMQSVPVAQRLGAMLTLDAQAELIVSLARWLQDKPMRLVALEGSLPPQKTRTRNVKMAFKVWSSPTVLWF
jgi:hypothetical protein